MHQLDQKEVQARDGRARLEDESVTASQCIGETSDCQDRAKVEWATYEDPRCIRRMLRLSKGDTEEQGGNRPDTETYTERLSCDQRQRSVVCWWYLALRAPLPRVSTLT